MVEERQIAIDVGSLTLGELEVFEEIAGLPATALSGSAGIPAKALTALVYITMRRADPDYTIEAAREERVANVRPAGGAPDPTSAATGGAGGDG